MKTVLQPLNEKAAKIVTEHADLLEGSSVEPLLLQLVAHVSAYRVILERWISMPGPASATVSMSRGIEKPVGKLL